MKIGRIVATLPLIMLFPSLWAIEAGAIESDPSAVATASPDYSESVTDPIATSSPDSSPSVSDPIATSSPDSSPAVSDPVATSSPDSSPTVDADPIALPSPDETIIPIVAVTKSRYVSIYVNFIIPAGIDPDAKTYLLTQRVPATVDIMKNGASVKQYTVMLDAQGMNSFGTKKGNQVYFLQNSGEAFTARASVQLDIKKPTDFTRPQDYPVIATYLGVGSVDYDANFADHNPIDEKAITVPLMSAQDFANKVGNKIINIFK